MSDGTLLGVLWSVLGFLVAVAAGIDYGQLGVIFTIGGMLVSATWYLGSRFSKVESRLATVEEHLTHLSPTLPSSTTSD